jgi:hypothetical protein
MVQCVFCGRSCTGCTNPVKNLEMFAVLLGSATNSAPQSAAFTLITLEPRSRTRLCQAVSLASEKKENSSSTSAAFLSHCGVSRVSDISWHYLGAAHAASRTRVSGRRDLMSAAGTRPRPANTSRSALRLRRRRPLHRSSRAPIADFVMTIRACRCVRRSTRRGSGSRGCRREARCGTSTSICARSGTR